MRIPCSHVAMLIAMATAKDATIMTSRPVGIGMRRSFASRALGRAYLAFCEPDEQDVLTRLLQRSRYD